MLWFTLQAPLAARLWRALGRLGNFAPPLLVQ